MSTQRPSQGSTEAELLSAALEFCRRSAARPDDRQLREEVERWRGRSLAHEQAWRQAQLTWAAAGTLRSPRRGGPWEALLLHLELLGERLRARLSWRGLLPLPLLGCGLLLMLKLPPPAATLPAPSPALVPVPLTSDYRSANEQRQVVLADGSVVHLNWHSHVRVALSPDYRRVELLVGEALFDVAHDPNRPFSVQAQEVRATALGTVYGVRQDGDEVIVTVSAGRVEVDSPAPSSPLLLEANQSVVARGRGLGEVREIDAEDASAWKDGLLRFRDHPLPEVLEELARYTPFAIQSELDGDGRRVTASYLTTRATDALGQLAQAYDLELELRGPGGPMAVRRQPPLRPD